MVRSEASNNQWIQRAQSIKSFTARFFSAFFNPPSSMEIHKNNAAKVAPGPSNAYGSGSSKEQFDQQIPGLGHEVKRRKRHRRKHFQNQEPCLMRGVYFKNLKWQATIKVDKKQIHLGIVATQEEVAHLYDS